MSKPKVEEVLAGINQVMKSPNVSLHIVQTFTHGRAIQVRLKTRKIGPLIFPAEGQTLADVLHMLGTMADE